MSKVKANLRNVVAIVICLVVTAMLWGCEKKIDYDKLEGTTWKAEKDNVVFTLRFVDDTHCTLMMGRLDGTYSANSATYFWEYNLSSRWGLFLLNELNVEGEMVLTYSGTVENKELYLYGSMPENHLFEIKFKRMKN